VRIFGGANGGNEDLEIVPSQVRPFVKPVNCCYVPCSRDETAGPEGVLGSGEPGHASYYVLDYFDREEDFARIWLVYVPWPWTGFGGGLGGGSRRESERLGHFHVPVALRIERHGDVRFNCDVRRLCG
jgi:hypothetical protein